MKTENYVLKLIIFLLLINLSITRHFDISEKARLGQKIKKNKNNEIRNLQENVFEPMRILIDTTYLEKLVTDANLKKEPYYRSFERCKSIVSDLINVKPITTPIKVDFSSHTYLDESIVNGTLVTGNSDYDLIIITRIDLQVQNDMNSTTIIRDPNTHRTVLGLIEFNIINSKIPDNYFHYFDYLLLHHIIHLLGFSYESFEYFPGGKDKTYVNSKDAYGLDRNYIITEKVVKFAQKYFGCPSLDKLPLENQKQDEDEAHWEGRIFLGEIMSSYISKADLVLSDFTIYLLEDSGWYTINHYTGGLMRFGKNKGCDFVNKKCSSEYKNEYFNYLSDGKNFLPSCSSGRQSRAYRLQNFIRNVGDYKIYYTNNNQNYFGPIMLELCIVSDTHDTDQNNNYFSGNCKLGNSDYGGYISNLGNYNNNREGLTRYMNESFSNNSFCILASIDHINSDYNLNQTVLSYCYEMFCTETRLTIKIGGQYIVCPKSGGKVPIYGNYNGYVYCPDYNLICTGTSFCNDIFDCISNKSLSKDNTYTYNYEIKTNQLEEEFSTEGYLTSYETESDGKCPINCFQCYEGGQCFRCRDGYYLIAKHIGEITNNCRNDIDINIGYFLYNNIYYPCLDNCHTCRNQTLCEKCVTGYYFLKNDRTYCDTGKDVANYYYTTDEGISYFPCDTNFPNCEQCKNKENECYKCKYPYYFIKTKETCVTGLDLERYFSEDNNILYLLCSDYINNCKTCNKRDNCIRCDNEYYFIKDNRTFCHTGYNFKEYYTTDGGISYYPCDTNFPNCLECSDSTTCDKCKDKYIFLRGQKTECFTDEKDKTYIENGNYYPCSDSLPFCDKCSSKYLCYECMKDYYLVRNKNNIGECLKIDLAKYYKQENNYYKLCSEAIDNCDECNNGTTCTKCKEGFYFLKNNFTNCRNDLDIRKYYSDDGGISYYPCNEQMPECKYCSEKNICEECNENFYLIKENKKDCVKIDDLEKYYKNGTSYYPCYESIPNCNKCFDYKSCYECLGGAKIIYQEQNKCYFDDFFEKNQSYYKINDTFYGKCSIVLPNCDTCNNESFCIKCYSDHFFINDNYKECINITDIEPEKEYYKKDELNYYTCSYKGVNNCKECIDESTCLLCDSEYALLSYDYSLCYLKSELQKGFYHDIDEVMYFPCLENCDICSNDTECITCKDNFITFESNKVCDICKVNINYINENFTYDLLKDYTNNYINENMNSFSNVNVYINEEDNFFIIIYRAWYCTSSLLENDYFEINTDELAKKLSYNLKTSEHFVISYVNYKYKNYLEIYDMNKKELINIEENCPDCLSENILKIKNNFTKELNSSLGEILQNKIGENNINIFNKDDPIFNDICLNFTLESVDVTLRERIELFFLGNKEKEILCNDKNCSIESLSMENFNAICNCKIQTDFNNLFIENSETTNNITKEEYDKFLKSKTSINTFVVFKCAKEAFSSKKIKNNVNLYITCVFIAIQVVLFGFYFGYHKSKKSKNKNPNKKSPKKKEISKPNPPKIDKFSVSDDLDEDEETYPKLRNDNADLEKINQEKDKQILYDDVENEDDAGDIEKNIQDKDIDSVREREIENEIINSGGEVTEETLASKINHFRGKRIRKTKYSKEIIYSESDQDPDEMSSNKKYKFRFEDDLEGDEGANENNYNLKKKNKKNRSKNKEYIAERETLDSKESFTPSELNDIQKEITQKNEYISFSEAIKNPSASFWDYYFKLIQLKQPIINLLSPIKCLKIEDSHIPTLVKLMRMVLIFSLNMFFNVLHLDQKYFRAKYKHFSQKYNIRYVYLDKKISLNERFSYGMAHAALSGFISFLICLIIQSILNFFIFNIKKKLSEIDNTKEDSNKTNKMASSKNDILQIMKKTKKIYLIFFSIGFAIMIIVFFSAINFAGVYIGGELDFIAGFFWTFIFLQIVPFIYCLIFALFRYKGIKNNNEKLYKLGQSIFF